MPKRYYTKTMKDGTVKRRVHDSKTGKILRWEIADDLETPQGEFKIVEYTMSFIPTREKMKNTPSSFRNFEVRVRLPENDDLDDEDIKEYGRNALEELTNEEMVITSEFSFNKRGYDVIGYSNNDEPTYKVIDTVRPQYKYPKKSGFGTIDELKP